MTLAAWMFLALSMLALLSPVGASHDELFHAGSIWCANSVDAPTCIDVSSDPTRVQNEVVDFPVRYGVVPIKAKVCQRPADQALVCPASSDQYSTFQINNGMYPSLYYRFMHQLVGPSVEKSIVGMRVFNALLASLAIGIMGLLLDPRKQIILITAGFVGMYSSGWYLAASINPSALSILGVATSWLFLDAMLQPKRTPTARIMSFSATAATALLVVATRWDAVVYLLVSYVFVAVFHIAQRKSVGSGKILLVALSLAAVAAMGVTAFTPLLITDQLRLLFTYEPGQPDNVAFVSHYVLHAVPKLLESFYELPTQAGIWLPRLVQLCGFVVIAIVLVPAIRKPSGLQGLLIVAVTVLIAFVLMGHAAGIDQRDPFGPSHRYVLPLLPFAVGYLLITSRSSTGIMVMKYRQLFVAAYTLGFALMTFTVAERFVDKQTFGLRLVPESIDAWWWSEVPFGPNVAVGISIFAMYKAVSRMSQFSRS